MESVGEILKTAKECLQKSGIKSYALDAELLLANAIGLSREKIICYPEKELNNQQIDEFNSLIKRREKREPVSHLLETREFWGRSFKVTKDTLDPRADSEALIEAALELFVENTKLLNIIDFGTGTGCLLLTLLAEIQSAKGVAVDISEAAIDVAKHNAEKLRLAKRCEFVVSNWGREVKGKYDLIISNPPYIKNIEIDGLEPEVSVYDPRNALDGGNDGLKCYKDLAPFISSLISEDGFAIIELGVGQDEQVRAIMESVGLIFVAYKQDLTGINRCIVVKA